ncbi:MAG TPA: hypothetical protein VGR35_20965 [Tepidisphaeraceae bacterium]|nr:hypothetical protein [Tepidisphaeraceae bacterium]
MKIDRTHLPWVSFSGIALAACVLLYAYDVTRGSGALHGPSGGSFSGLTLGIMAAAFMLFAGLLGARRRMRTWRIGRAEFWMRGHLWLGALALPIALLHGGFRHGGTLTNVLMWLLYLVIVSGFVGASLQHFLPGWMAQAVPGETVYEQIPRVLARLAAEAEAVAAASGPGASDEASARALEEWRRQRMLVLDAQYDKGILSESQRDLLKSVVATAPAEGAASLRAFHERHVGPFLRRGDGAHMANPQRARAIFIEQRVSTPPALHELLGELQRICEEARQLWVQRRMHQVLHGWLLVHVPLSYATMILAAVHAVVALRYSW